MEFKIFLKEFLSEKQLSQEEFAKSIQTSQGTVSKWLNGTQDPSYTHLRSICIEYGVDANCLLGIVEY